MPLDRRYQIFVSSTFRDLAAERKKAVEVIFDRGHIPIALEGFSARNAGDREVIESAIQDCQIYLLIVGHRYGELVPGEDISFTELEYEIAQKYQLLTLVFILNEDEVTERRSELDPAKKRDEAELKNFDRLQRFHERLRQHFRQIWGTKPELGASADFRFLVANALNDNLPTCSKPGFVREPEEPTMALLRSAAQNEFIVDIVDQLRGFEKLYLRCSVESEEKREAARFFRQRYADRIVKHNVTLFFESGSTIAYVAKMLSDPLKKAVRVDKRGRPSMQISTNNILAYLLLWLRARVPCTLFPWSPPGEETYGASYGGLEEIEKLDPDYTLPPLDDIARAEITKLLELPFTLDSWPPPSLLLGAASGLQIRSEHKVVFRDGLDESTKKEKLSQLEKCFGPHVGSYHNKIFKRDGYSLDSGDPKM